MTTVRLHEIINLLQDRLEVINATIGALESAK